MSALRLADAPPLPSSTPPAAETIGEPSYECDHCARTFKGPPGGAGLLVWTRGDEVRYEEPPLCEECAAKISVGALMRWDVEEEEEG